MLSCVVLLFEPPFCEKKGLINAKFLVPVFQVIVFVVPVFQVIVFVVPVFQVIVFVK